MTEEVIRELDLCDNIICISFDTAASGPGIQIILKFQSLCASIDKKSSSTIMLDVENPFQGFLEAQRMKMVSYVQKS